MRILPYINKIEPKYNYHYLPQIVDRGCIFDNLNIKRVSMIQILLRDINKIYIDKYASFNINSVMYKTINIALAKGYTIQIGGGFIYPEL